MGERAWSASRARAERVQKEWQKLELTLTLTLNLTLSITLNPNPNPNPITEGVVEGGEEAQVVRVQAARVGHLVRARVRV